MNNWVKSLTNSQYKNISKTILENCPHYLGYPPNYNNQLPKLYIRNNPKIKDKGEYAYGMESPSIYLYKNNTTSPQDLISTIIHEYTHYIQLYNKRSARRYEKAEEDIGYDKNPYEIEANLMDLRYSAKMYARVCHLFK